MEAAGQSRYGSPWTLSSPLQPQAARQVGVFEEPPQRDEVVFRMSLVALSLLCSAL